MKKLLALFLILLLMLSAFGCAKPDEETGAEAGLVDTPAPQPEKTPEPEKEPATKEPTPDTQTKEPEKEQPETEGPQPTGDKAPFCDVKIDEPFSPNEVVVTLTLEESVKGKVYTAQDFPNADCFYAFEFDYYPEKYHPEYKGRVTLMLMLNEPSKENVLKTVKILEQDSRVYSAEPNFIIGTSTCLVSLTTEENSKNIEYNKNTFEYENITEVDEVNKGYVKNVIQKDTKVKWLSVKYDESRHNAVVKQLLADKRFNIVLPITINIEPDCIMLTKLKKDKEIKYSIDDFPNLPIKEVKNSEHFRFVDLYLQKGGYREAFTVYNALKDDDRFESVGFNEIGYVF